MTDTVLTGAALVPNHQRKSWSWPATLASVGVAFIVFNGAIRNAEAVSAARAMQLLTHGTTWVVFPTHTFYWSVNNHVIGLHITGECTSALLIGPLMILGGTLLVGNRFPRPTILWAVGAVALHDWMWAGMGFLVLWNVQFLCVAVLGEYIVRTHRHTQRRPLYIVDCVIEGGRSR